MTASHRDIDDDAFHRALIHEVRRAIVRTLRKESPLSPVDCAERLELPLSNVSYHVRVLEDLGAVVLVRTEPTRGSLKHFYRLTDEFRQLAEKHFPPAE